MGTVLQLTLRVWVGFVGAVAIINGVKCQFDYDYAKTYLYMEQPDQATPLFSRMFGNWTLLAAAIRIGFAFSPYNRSLYWVTLFSFALAFWHFLSEVLLTATAPLTVGTIVPLILSSMTMLWMLVAWKPQRKREDKLN